MKNGLTLTEEAFCQLVATGGTAREAYSQAFSVAATDARTQNQIDKRASRLMKRPEIAARIAEAAGEQKRRNRALWERRGEEIAEGIFAAVALAIESVDANGKPMILDRDTLKGVEVLAKLKGLNAPEEHTLRNGGVAENYTAPRGLQDLSDEQLAELVSDARKSEVVAVDAGGAA